MLSAVGKRSRLINTVLGLGLALGCAGESTKNDIPKAHPTGNAAQIQDEILPQPEPVQEVIQELTPEPVPEVVQELTPEEKAQTVAQMKEEIGKRRISYRKEGEDGERVRLTNYQNNILEALETIDPVLVGRNVVFSPEWLRYIGEDKDITPENFTRWVSRIDRLYDCFADFVGTTPPMGEKVYVEISSHDYDEKILYGHAENTASMISIGRVNKHMFQEINEHDSWNYVVMHELAHLFEGTVSPAERESMANLLKAYAVEHIGAKFGTPGGPNRSQQLLYTRGTTHREKEYNRAVKYYENNNIKATAYHGGTALDYYLFGLVDKVGWDVYKKALHSYHDEKFIPIFYSMANPQAGRARDFFDRLEHFSGKEGVLRTLPDKGALLDAHFNPTYIPKHFPPSTIKRPFIRHSSTPGMER